MFLVLVIAFALFINNSIIIYNEYFLLCVFLGLFFILIYIIFNNNIKLFVFLKIFKSFYIFLILFKLNIFFNIVCKFFYLKKKLFIKLYFLRFYLLEEAAYIVYKNIIQRSMVVINILFLLNFKSFNKIIRNYNSFALLYLNIRHKSNDIILLY